MHTWFFVYDEYMKRDDPENKDVEKQQHHHQQQQQQHQNVSSLNNNKMVEGWNNNKTPVAPPLHHHHPNQHFQQNPQYGATNARGGAMTGRLESRSVPNLDNNASRENTASPPPPPNYTSATQQLKQQSAQHLSNHHTQHPQQYAGKNVGHVSKYTIPKLISHTKNSFLPMLLTCFRMESTSAAIFSELRTTTASWATQLPTSILHFNEQRRSRIWESGTSSPPTP